jgi:hypothetical protein
MSKAIIHRTLGGDNECGSGVSMIHRSPSVSSELLLTLQPNSGYGKFVAKFGGSAPFPQCQDTALVRGQVDPYHGLCSAPPATFKDPQPQVPRIVPLQSQQSPRKSPRFLLCFPLIMAPPTYIIRVPPGLLLNSIIRARPFNAGAITIRSLLREFSFFRASSLFYTSLC